MNRAVYIAAAGALLAWSGTAVSYFEIADKASTEGRGQIGTRYAPTIPSAAPGDRYQLVADKQQKHIVEYGQPRDADVVKGFGEDIPVNDAMELLIPDGWMAYTSDTVDAGISVDWESGESWVATLGQIARANDLRAEVDWNRNQVILKGLRRMRDDMERLAAGALKYDERDGRQPQKKQTLDDFLAERVSVDVSGASIREALQSMLPPTWSIDFGGDYVGQLDTHRVDFTTDDGERRGRALNAFGESMELRLTPYVGHEKLVVEQVK